MNAEPTDDALIEESEKRLLAAIKARDIPGLEAELTEDFVHSAIGGAENPRAAFLEGVRAMPYRVFELVGQALRTRVFGDLALLEGIQRARVELEDGKAVDARTAFVDVFVRTGNGWKLQRAVELPEATTETEGEQ